MSGLRFNPKSELRMVRHIVHSSNDDSEYLLNSNLTGIVDFIVFKKAATWTVN